MNNLNTANTIANKIDSDNGTVSNDVANFEKLFADPSTYKSENEVADYQQLGNDLKTLMNDRVSYLSSVEGIKSASVQFNNSTNGNMSSVAMNFTAPNNPSYSAEINAVQTAINDYNKVNSQNPLATPDFSKVTTSITTNVHNLTSPATNNVSQINDILNQAAALTPDLSNNQAVFNALTNADGKGYYSTSGETPGDGFGEINGDTPQALGAETPNNLYDAIESPDGSGAGTVHVNVSAAFLPLTSFDDTVSLNTVLNSGRTLLNTYGLAQPTVSKSQQVFYVDNSDLSAVKQYIKDNGDGTTTVNDGIGDNVTVPTSSIFYTNAPDGVGELKTFKFATYDFWDNVVNNQSIKVTDQRKVAPNYIGQENYTNPKTGQTYYLAGYAVDQGGSADEIINPLKEGTDNHIIKLSNYSILNHGLIPGTDQGTSPYVYLYYLEVPKDPKLSLDAKLLASTNMINTTGLIVGKSTLSTLKNGVALSALTAPIAVNKQSVSGLTYLVGTAAKLTTLSDFADAPEIQLNQPKQASKPTQPTTGNNTPGQPGQPTTGDHTPGQPDNPAQPGKPTNPDTPIQNHHSKVPARYRHFIDPTHHEPLHDTPTPKSPGTPTDPDGRQPHSFTLKTRGFVDFHKSHNRVPNQPKTSITLKTYVKGDSKSWNHDGSSTVTASSTSTDGSKDSSKSIYVDGAEFTNGSLSVTQRETGNVAALSDNYGNGSHQAINAVNAHDNAANTTTDAAINTNSKINKGEFPQTSDKHQTGFALLGMLMVGLAGWFISKKKIKA